MFSRVYDLGEWKALLESALFRTFFHSPEWEEFLEKEFSWLKFERYVWRDEFLLSIARCTLFGREKIVSHPLCEYGGPLPLKKQADITCFIKDFTKEFGENARIKLHPYIRNADMPQDISSFWIEDFSRKTDRDLWQGLRKSLRQEIKMAAEAGITISECIDGEELREFYKLYVSTVKRHKNIPLTFRAIEFLGGHARLFIARKLGRVIGGSIFLLYNPFIHYFINASDYRLRALNIGHAILWHVIQKYVGGEYDYFDLGGTRKGSALETFKRGWGAKEYPIYEIGRARGGEVESWKRNLWGMLPAQVVKLLASRALFFKV